MDSKAGFSGAGLPLTKQADSFQYSQRSESNISFGRKMVSHGIKIFGVLTLLYIAFAHWPHNTRTHPVKEVQLQNAYYRNEDPTMNFTRRVHFPLNISSPDLSPFFEFIQIRESLDICGYSWNATGTLKLARADLEQQHNFMVSVNISASSQTVLDLVGMEVWDHGKALSIKCADIPGSEYHTGGDAHVHVDVNILIKPQPVQYWNFMVSLQDLNLEVVEGLELKTSNLYLGSAQGNVLCAETQNFNANYFSVSSTNGSISGHWPLTEFLVLTNGNGSIDIDLVPNSEARNPYLWKRLSATSEGGDISIRTLHANDTAYPPFTFVNVYSKSGTVTGTYVTEYGSSLKTESGTINASVLPYYSRMSNAFPPYTFSINTASGDGNTWIEVLPAVVDSHSNINPLNNTRSEHTSSSGNISLQYPTQWKGAALGLSETGNVSICGAVFDDVIQRNHLVVARTDDKLASRLDFSTKSGDGILVVG